MLRKIGVIMLYATMIIATNAHAKQYIMQAGIFDYELPVNAPLEFVNYMFWTVEAKCEIIATDPEDELIAEAIFKQGTVNSIPLLEGHSMSLIVHSGEYVYIKADSGAKVRITNHGQNTVKVACSV